MSEDKLTGWHHRCIEHELGQTLGMVRYKEAWHAWCPWGHKGSDTTGPLKQQVTVNTSSFSIVQIQWQKWKKENCTYMVVTFSEVESFI